MFSKEFQGFDGSATVNSPKRFAGSDFTDVPFSVLADTLEEHNVFLPYWPSFLVTVHITLDMVSEGHTMEITYYGEKNLFAVDASTAVDVLRQVAYYEGKKQLSAS